MPKVLKNPSKFSYSFFHGVRVDHQGPRSHSLFLTTQQFFSLYIDRARALIRAPVWIVCKLPTHCTFWDLKIFLRNFFQHIHEILALFHCRLYTCTMTKNTFYLDMDGVVADWEAAASTFLRRPMRDPDTLTHYRNTPEEWAQIKTQTRFYRDLPLMPRVDELVDLARQYRDTLGWELLFLTAVPKNDDVHWAFYDKVLWAQRHFPDIAVHFGPHSWDKCRHCRAGDILVDDRPDNCAQWREAGGLAFKVDGNDLGSVLDSIRQDLKLRVDRKNQRDLVLDLI